ASSSSLSAASACRRPSAPRARASTRAACLRCSPRRRPVTTTRRAMRRTARMRTISSSVLIPACYPRVCSVHTSGSRTGMALPDVDTALGWRGRTMVDPAGEELGKVTNLYLEGESQRPAWAGIKRGLLRGETVVRRAAAEEADGSVRVPYERAVVEDAPDVDPDIELSEDDEQVLRDHYGRGGVDTARHEDTDSAV